MAAAFVDALLADPTLAALQKQVTVPLTLAGVTSNAAAATAALTTAFAAACWVGQVTTGYWSWVDRLWSIVPVLYAGTFALYHPGNARVVLMAALTLAWGVRLSLNFARKGGYSHEEDYRWPLIRAVFAKYGALGAVARELFSLGFVAVYQHALLWLIAGPQTFIASVAADGGALTTRDYALAAAFLTLLAFETLTDEQQWAFQSKKYAMTPAERKKAGGDYARGFRTTGVFAYSRHLNFFCEQSMWWVIYGFTLSSGAPLLNWSILGPALLSGLFLGSTGYTESLSLSKYPAYAAYQRTTSRLLPWLPGPALDSPEGQQLVAEATGSASASSSSRKRK